MCTSGTPLCVMGGPARVFKRKNLYVVVPLLTALNVVMQKLDMLFLHRTL
jgi:hypothetical protein